jgi:elongation factor G
MNQVARFRPEDIRNVVLLGHGGAGKTTLAEAMLHRCGVISRMGSVADGTTTADFEPEARAHQHSTNSTLLFATREGRELNVIDTPGHPEFIGAALAALPAVEAALLVVSATAGVEFNTRRLFHAAGEAGLARMVVLNKIDGVAPAVLRARVDELKEAFGARLHCLNLPTRGGADVIDCFDQDAGAADLLSVKEVHAEVLESTVEVDDAMLERYLAGGRLDLTELRRAFVTAMAQGHVVPVLFTSARDEVGVDALLHVLIEEAPSPVTGRRRRLLKDGVLTEVPCAADMPLLAHVFKVTNDPGAGPLALVRVLQGTLGGNTTFVCGRDTKARKAGHVLKVEGRDHPELDAVASAGDLVALARLEDVHVDQVLRAPELEGDWRAVPRTYPAPMVSLAVESKQRGDDVKLAQSLARLAEEDPTFSFRHDPVTQELVLSGVGDVHLAVLLERLRNRFKLEVSARAPTVAYRETVTERAEGHCRHKKQTGGAGQFAEVFLRVEPLPRGAGVEFKSEVFGGTIPTQFIPSVEKGVFDALEAGVVAGFPVYDVRVVVVDGKHHPVDSKDIAFRTAGKMATRDALARARPVLLEPVANLEVSTPEQHLGAVTSDVKHVRGRVLGVEAQPGGLSLVRAQAPIAELGGYAGQLRGSTAGAGSFAMALSHYEPVPPAQQQRVIDARPARKAAAD